MYDGLLKIALAKGEARAGDADRAVAIIDEALATADRIGHRTFEAELHRARGEILLGRDPADPAPAEAAFVAAIAVAQAATGPQLRAARRAVASQALPVHRPPDRRPRRSRSGAGRLFADVGVSGDRRGDAVSGREQSGRGSIMTRATNLGVRTAAPSTQLAPPRLYAASAGLDARPRTSILPVTAAEMSAERRS